MPPQSKTRAFAGALGLVAILMVTTGVPSTQAQVLVGALTLQQGEGPLASAIIDPANGFAYFGSDTSPGVIVKIRLSDFTRVGALTLTAGQGNLRSAIIDSSNGFAYFGTYTSPGIVLKIRLYDFKLVDSLTLNTGEQDLTSAVIDTVGGYVYFGTDTLPGKVVKIRLSDFSRIGAVTLNPGEGNLRSALIDNFGSFAYFGSDTQPGRIVEIRLSNLTRVDAIILGQFEGGVVSAVSVHTPPFGGYALFGTSSSPSLILAVTLKSFLRVSTIILGRENNLVSAAVDPIHTYAYFGTDTSDASDIVVKVTAPVLGSSYSLPQLVGSIRLQPGEAHLRCAVMDVANDFAYFGTYTTPGTIIKISGSEGSHTPSTSTSSASSNITGVPASSHGILGIASQLSLGLVGVAVAAITSSAVIMVIRKRKHPFSSRILHRISTGYGELDALLHGGIPIGYSVLLISPPCDERDLLLRKMLKSNLSSGTQVFHVSGDLGRTQDLVGMFRTDFYAFSPEAHRISSEQNLFEIPGVGNLVEFNILLNKGLKEHAKEGKTKLIVMDLLSDLLARHKWLVTRKWLTEFIGKRRSQNFTTLCTLNPAIASGEERGRITDLFDGIIEILEKETEGKLKRLLVVRKMYGQEYSESELVLDRGKLF